MTLFLTAPPNRYPKNQVFGKLENMASSSIPPPMAKAKQRIADMAAQLIKVAAERATRDAIAAAL